MQRAAPFSLVEIRVQALGKRFRIVTDRPDLVGAWHRVALNLDVSSRCVDRDSLLEGEKNSLLLLHDSRLYEETKSRMDARPSQTAIQLQHGLSGRFAADDGAFLARLSDRAAMGEAHYEAVQFCRSFLSLLCLEDRVLFMHMAGAALNGRACLFVGRNGAGKSTCARALALDGGEFLADDCLPVRRSTGSFEAALFPEAVNLGSIPAAERGRLVEAGFLSTPIESVYWPPSRPGSPWRAAGALFFPRILPRGPARALPLRDKSGLLGLLENRHTPVLQGREEFFFQTAIDLLDRVPSFILEMGPDLQEIVPAVRSALD